MRILIVTATHKEAGFLNQLDRASAFVDVPVLPGLEDRIRYYHYKGLELISLVTGTGMVSTAFCLGQVMGHMPFGFALNAGIAGSYNKQVKPGDVVWITEDQVAWLGAEDDGGFIPMTQLGLPSNETDSAGILHLHYEGNAVLESLRNCRAITVNTVHGNEATIRRTEKHYHADIESMEGAAFMYACLKANAAGAQVRAISNYVERRNRGSWEIEPALNNLGKVMFRILDSFA